MSGADDKGWLLADWCDQCHRKNGLVVWAGAERADGFLGEPLLDLLLGKIDALEILIPRFTKETVLIAPLTKETILIPPLTKGGLGGVLSPLPYDLWNAGLTIPLIGASAKDSNTTVLGQTRTSAKLLPGETFDYQAWIAAVRAGRTQVSASSAVSSSPSTTKIPAPC